MGTDDSRFLPVILGGDITAYSLARTFHEAYQIKSLVISQISSHLCADSSIIENRIVPDMENEEIFLKTLEHISHEFCGTKLILLACGDWYVRLIVEHRSILEEQGFILPYIGESLLNRLVLKDQFYKLCDEVGVTYPRTFIYDTKHPVDLAQVDLTFPLVAKPSSSAAYHYAQFPGKRKVFFFDDLSSLEEMLDNLRTSSYQEKFLLQEFIPGDDTQMRILTTYSDRTGKMRFAAFGQTLLEDKKAMGIGNPVAIISRENHTVVEEAQRLLESVGYTGFANFDIKVDPRNGCHHFFEINTRLGRSNYYVTASGHNVTRWIVEELIEGREFDDNELVIARGTESLYTVVPRSTLLDFVHDTSLRSEITRMYREGKAHNPLAYSAEKRLIRKIYPSIFLFKQWRAFKTAAKAAKANAKKGGA